MNSIHRRIIFWLFVIFFLFTTPTVIFYSQGYRFNQYKGIFIHSGSITVKSVPASVNIYLNGKLQPAGRLDMINNSITLNGLRPGNYDLKVTANGYGDWEKNVDVHSGISTEFWNVLLPQLNPPIKELNAEGVERYFASPFGKKIAYSEKNGANLEIWSLDVKKNEPTLIFSKPDFEFSSNPLENIEWDSNEQMLIAPVYSKGQKDFLILDSENVKTPILLSDLVPFTDLNLARWSPDNQEAVYFIAKSADGADRDLYRINISTNQSEVISEGISTYDLSGSSLYLLRQNAILYKTDRDGKNENQLLLAPIPFSDPSSPSRLIAYDDDRQAVISDSGELFVHNNATDNSVKKIADGAISAQFSDDGKKLLYWSNNEIDVLFLRVWKVQPRREENEIQQIIRFSTPIKNVFWYRDYEHIFFSTQNKIKITELDPRDHRSVSDIAEYTSENFLSSYDSANGIYYLVDEIDGKRKLFEINIPVQTGFFGG